MEQTTSTDSTAVDPAAVAAQAVTTTDASVVAADAPQAPQIAPDPVQTSDQAPADTSASANAPSAPGAIDPNRLTAADAVVDPGAGPSLDETIAGMQTDLAKEAASVTFVQPDDADVAKPERPDLTDSFRGVLIELEQAAAYVEGKLLEEAIALVAAIEVDVHNHPAVSRYQAELLAYLKSCK